jgi:outer membrane lipoprotein SlyB
MKRLSAVALVSLTAQLAASAGPSNTGSVYSSNQKINEQ